MLRNSTCHEWGEATEHFSHTCEGRSLTGTGQSGCVVVKLWRSWSIYFESSASGNWHLGDTNIAVSWADSAMKSAPKCWGEMSAIWSRERNDKAFPLMILAALFEQTKWRRQDFASIILAFYNSSKCFLSYKHSRFLEPQTITTKDHWIVSQQGGRSSVSGVRGRRDRNTETKWKDSISMCFTKSTDKALAVSLLFLLLLHLLSF